MTTFAMYPNRHSRLIVIGGLVAGLFLTGCSGAEPPAEEPEVPSPVQEEPVEAAPESTVDTQGRVIYGVAKSGDDWGVYASSDGIDWELLAALPEDFNGSTQLGSGSTSNAVAYYSETVLSTTADWQPVGTSTYSFNGGMWEVHPVAYADGSWWSLEAGGLWTSADAMTWELSYDVVDEWQNFRDGVELDGALPKGELYGNGELMLIPRTAQRSLTSILPPTDLWEESTLSVWLSSDGETWERHEVEISGEAPGEVAQDIFQERYLWDGARWLWVADDVLYAAEDTGDTLVFEQVGEIAADGETPRGTPAAAGDLLVVPATEVAGDYDGGGAVLVSVDGGQSWGVHEVDIYLASVLGVIEG